MNTAIMLGSSNAGAGYGYPSAATWNGAAIDASMAGRSRRATCASVAGAGFFWWASKASPICWSGIASRVTENRESCAASQTHR
jgi:hypothetical protein